KKHKHICLYHTDNYSKTENGNRNDCRNQDTENHENHVLCYHVAEKSYRQRYRAHKMADDFNEEHEYHERQCSKGSYRPQKVIYIFNPVYFYAVIMSGKKYRNRHRGGHINIARRRFKTRNKTHEITETYVKEQRADKRIKLESPVVSDYGIRKV